MSAATVIRAAAAPFEPQVRKRHRLALPAIVCVYSRATLELLESSRNPRPRQERAIEASGRAVPGGARRWLGQGQNPQLACKQMRNVGNARGDLPMLLKPPIATSASPDDLERFPLSVVGDARELVPGLRRQFRPASGGHGPHSISAASLACRSCDGVRPFARSGLPPLRVKPSHAHRTRFNYFARRPKLRSGSARRRYAS